MLRLWISAKTYLVVHHKLQKSITEPLHPNSLSGTVRLHSCLYLRCVLTLGCALLLYAMFKGSPKPCPCMSFMNTCTVAIYFLQEVFVSWLYQSNWLLFFSWQARLCSTCYSKEHNDKLRISDVLLTITYWTCMHSDMHDASLLLSSHVKAKVFMYVSMHP